MLCLCFSSVNLVPSANRHSWGGRGGERGREGGREGRREGGMAKTVTEPIEIALSLSPAC